MTNRPMRLYFPQKLEDARSFYKRMLYILKILTVSAGALLFLSAVSFPYTIIEDSPSRFSVEFSLEPDSVSLVESGGYTAILVPERFSHREPSGFPDIPSQSIIIGISDSFSIRAEKEVVPYGKGRVKPVPTPNLRNDIWEYKITENDSVYSTSDFYPNDDAVFLDMGDFRSQHIAAIRYYPVRFNPETGEIELVKKLTVSVIFHNPSGKTVPEGRYEHILKNLLSNYKSALRLRRRKQRKEYYNPFSPSDRWYKFYINSNGIYKLDYNLLSNLGIQPETISPDDVRLFNGGGRKLPAITFEQPKLQEIPLLFFGDDDKSIEPEEYFIFWGNGINFLKTIDLANYSFNYHPYARENCYFIAIGGDFSTPAARMEQFTKYAKYEEKETGFALDHFEEKRIYNAGIDWGWDRFTTRTYSFTEDRIASSNGVVRAYPQPSYIVVNGEASSYDPIDRGFPVSTLAPGTNHISFHYSRETFFYYFEVEYEKRLSLADDSLTFLSPKEAGTYRYNIEGDSIWIFDVTDRFSVRYSVGGTVTDSVDSVRRIYFATTPSSFRRVQMADYIPDLGLRADISGGEYIIIADEEFNITDIRDFREKFSGFRVKVATLQQIYNEFSWGVFDPGAIRNYIKYALENWGVPPEFVLLVGDGHYDYKEITTRNANPLPPAGEGVYFSDDWYLKTDPASLVPQVAAGRFCANSQRELDIITSKVIDYEYNPHFGNWRNRYILCGDDENTTTSHSEGMHTTQTSELQNFLPYWGERRMLYMVEYPMNSQRLKPEANADLINWINEGAVVVNFIGHGNYHLWAHEHLFDSNSDIARLSNGRMLPLVNSFSCAVSEFFVPGFECLSERMQREADKGSIASIAATGPTTPSPNASLNYNLFNLLFMNRPKPYLGEALLAAKILGTYSSNDAQYLLFGDPATRLANPDLPVVIDSMTPDEFIALTRITIYGSVRDTSGELLPIDGKVNIKVFDSDYIKTYTLADGTGSTIQYTKPGNILFSGEFTVTKGEFQAGFILPREISYGANCARITAYAYNDTFDAAGGLDSIPISTHSEITELDTIPPSVKIYIGNKGFSDFDLVPNGSVLYAEVSDESGINTTGQVGHTITLIIDENIEQSTDITGYFRYNIDSSTDGLIVYTLPLLSPGIHTAAVKVWDNFGNATLETVHFEVADDNISVKEILPYPSPFTDGVWFTFILYGEGEADISIFTLSGRLVRRLKDNICINGFNKIYWDGKDENGREVPNGTYLYKLVVRKNDTKKEFVKKVSKIK